MASLLSRLAALALFAAALALAACDREPTIEDEDANQKFREISDAFTGPVSSDGGKHAADIKKLFDGLGAALRINDEDAIRRHMDFKMMVQLLDKQNLLRGKLKGNRSQVVDAIGKMLPAQLSAPDTGIVWDRFELRKVRFVAAEDEAVVIARSWDADGFSTKQRWWIYKDGDNWRAYDLELLEVSMRYSTLLGVGFAVAEQGEASKNDMQALINTVSLVTSGQVDEADKALMAISDSNLPPVLVAMRHIFIAGIRIDQKRYDEAMTSIKAAEGAQPDMPMLDAFRAMAYNGLGKHDEALAAAKAYMDQLGEDAAILLEIGDAKLGQGKTDEAVAAYRAGLKDDPQSADNLLGLLRAQPDKAAALAEDYRALKEVTILFPIMVDELIARKHPAAARALIELHKSQHPKDAAIKEAEAKLKGLN